MATVSAEQLQLIMQTALTSALTAVSEQSQGNGNGGTRPRVKPPERPEIDLGFSETQWAFFEDEWNLYKRRAALQPDQLKDELRACCSKDLRRTLFDFVGSSALEALSEPNLLAKIKATAVIAKNKAVHRKEFYEIGQAPDEQLNLFLAKLKSKSERCNFTMKCTAVDCEQVNNYGEEMIRDQMTTGLYDKDVQQEVLAKDKELTTFDEFYTLIDAYEQGKRAKSELQNHSLSEINAAKSQYKKSKSDRGDDSKPSKRCTGCGGSPHGYMRREKDCPAWGKKCFQCGKSNHLKSYCKQIPASSEETDGTAAAAAAMDEHATALAMIGGTSLNSGVSYFYATFGKELQLQSRDGGVVAVPHIDWDGEKFCKATPPPLPTLEVGITPLVAYHSILLKTESTRIVGTVVMRAFTDTCAQTCVAGREILTRTKMSQSWLIPTSHSIKGVTDQRLTILGLMLVEISLHSKSTYAVLYICENVKGLFLTESVQKRLGIISSSYPNVSSACVQASGDPKIAPCGCQRRVEPPPPPEKIPFPPIEENTEKLREWIVETYAASGFNTCEHQPIKMLTGAPLDIHWREDVHPVACHTPVPVPLHYKQLVKEDIDRDVRIGVLEPVPQGVPTVWCSRMLVIPKKSGKPRRVVDYQAVNRASLRETHHTPTPFHLASSVPANMLKTMFDAWNSYHFLQLTEEAKNALTFITEYGRYRPLTAPQGFHGSGDGYTRRTDDIIAGFPRKCKCVDDSLLHDVSIEGAFWHAIDYIVLCNQNGVIFNREKFFFAKKELDFAGFTVTMDGVKPTKDMISSLEGFPVPKNRTDLKSFFGLVQFVSYVFSESRRLAPFRELLKKDTKWYWDDSLKEIFADCKQMIVRQVVDGVKCFKINLPCALWTDWCKEGIGFSLFQKRCDCAFSHVCCKDGWKMVLAKSRFTKGSELGYKPIEGEALAIVYALQKCKIFIQGCPKLLIVTDHKPLVSIFGSKCMDKIENPRLFSLKEKTLPYTFDIVHVKGVGNKAADAYSRNPSQGSEDEEISLSYGMKLAYKGIRSTEDAVGERNCEDTDENIDNKIEASLAASLSSPEHGNVATVSLERIKNESSKDESIHLLKALIINGFPSSKEELSEKLKPYWNVRDQLLVLNDNVLYKGRALVPPRLRREVLEILHSAHQGVVGMRARAGKSFFWPGINHDIDVTRGQCRDCNDISPSQSNEP